MTHGGDHVAAVLERAGVEHLFTLCGGHISPILSAARRRGLRVVDVRDEATAVFAADATARLTGVPGVAAVTAGPGATNTLTAVKNAQLAQSPVVLLCGAAPTLLKGRGALQDIDQKALFAPHVKRFLAVRRVRDLAGATADALRLAAAGVPGPVVVECPIDLLYDERLIRDWYAAASGGRSLSARLLGLYLRRHLRRLFAGSDRVEIPAVTRPAAGAPPEREFRRAASRLAQAKRPVIVIGSQALAQPEIATDLAGAIETIGAPVYLSGMARGLLGKNHPLHLRHRRRQALKQADLVLLAGVPSDFRLDYGKHVRRSATLLSVNRSRHDLRMNRRPDLGVLGDAGAFLTALPGHVEPGDRWRDWIGELRQADAEREAQIDALSAAPTDFLNPLRLLREVDRCLPEDSVIVADGGDFVGTAAYTLRPRGPLSWLDPGVFGTLGVGAGFSLGAKLARPGSEVWIVYGDGAAGFSLAEFDTFVRHQVPVVAIVGNDGSWAQIAREQVKMLGDDVATVLGRSAYHAAAEGLGAAGLLLDRPERTGQVLEEARAIAATGRPVLINAWIGTTDFREGSISM